VSGRVAETFGRMNLEQFEAFGHKLESGRKVLVVWTEYHVIQTDARDLNFIVLIFAQSLLEAYN
jgi:hypothetical protein